VDGFINGFICPPDNPDAICWSDLLGATLPTIEDDYDQETSDAFELGFNSILLDGTLRLNGAAYYTEVTDMQFFEFYVGTFGLLRVVSNIDKVDISGLEFGFDWALAENWRLYGGANWLDTEIKANSSRPDTVGNEAPYTPEYTANLGLEVTFPFVRDWEFFTRVDTRFVGETWFHTVQAGDRPTIFMPLFQLANPGVDGAGFLGTAEYSVSRRDSYAIADWRLGFRNDSWAVTAFATNLLNESYVEEVIPAPEFGGTFSAPGTLRRYGLEVSFYY
jgi:iron complex outermembrane receptor protein